MLSPELSTGLTLVNTALAIIAFIAAYGSFHFCLRVARERRDYRTLLLLLRELEDSHEALNASHKRLRSRVGMRELRAKRKGEQDEPERDPNTSDLFSAEKSKEAWKREKRIELATGKLKP